MSDKKVLIVDDEQVSAAFLKDLLQELKYDSVIARDAEEALEFLYRNQFDLIISDLVMPGMDGLSLVKRIKESHPQITVFILTAHGSYDVARRAQILGADDYLVKPVDANQLQIALSRFQEKMLLKSKLHNLGRIMKATYSASGIIGSSQAMTDVINRIDSATASQAPVLIFGESGTGKELAARAIYVGAGEKQGSFVTVNCAAISEGLIESELFGHARGSFSGAFSDREGLFEVADGGTMFLDEIGEIPLHSQTKLLRILQEGEFRRVGENKIRHVNTRIIAATNRDLERAVSEGKFREDLFYRLNVIPIHLPPLRERREDIPELVRHFLRKHSPESNEMYRISESALEQLIQYKFPGNIRELENIVQRALSFSPQNEISGDTIKTCLNQTPGNTQEEPEVNTENMSYKDLKNFLLITERKYLETVLRNSGGKVALAAERIGIARTALHNRIKKLGIKQ